MGCTGNSDWGYRGYGEVGTGRFDWGSGTVLMAGEGRYMEIPREVGRGPKTIKHDRGYWSF